MARRAPPCPDCGAPLSPGGRTCKGCGWDADRAESGDAYLDGVDLPRGYADDGEETAPAPRGRRLFFTLVALIALVSFVWAFVL